MWRSCEDLLFDTDLAALFESNSLQAMHTHTHTLQPPNWLVVVRWRSLSLSIMKFIIINFFLHGHQPPPSETTAKSRWFTPMRFPIRSSCALLALFRGGAALLSSDKLAARRGVSSFLRSVPPASVREQLERDTGLLLRQQEDGLEVALGPRSNALLDFKPFRIDFGSDSAVQRQQSASRELVVRALGRQRLDRVIDLTAGLGRDALMMAASDRAAQVVLVERNAVMHLLLSDALARLAKSNPALAARLSLHCLDSSAPDFSATLLSALPPPPESPLSTAVYLDPMYPQGAVGRKSLVKKETQVLHLVVDGDCGPAQEAANNAALFRSAVQLATTRIVVKRPLKSPPLWPSPHECLEGSTQRFDIYLVNRL